MMVADGDRGQCVCVVHRNRRAVRPSPGINESPELRIARYKYTPQRLQLLASWLHQRKASRSVVPFALLRDFPFAFLPVVAVAETLSCLTQASLPSSSFACAFSRVKIWWPRIVVASVIRALHFTGLPLSIPTNLRCNIARLLSYHSFVNVSILSTRFQTPVCKRTLSPVFTAKDATFDFPIYLSLSERLGVLEFVVWDKDMLRKEYLGEYALPLDEWFRKDVFAYDDPDNQARRIIRNYRVHPDGCNAKSFIFFITAIFRQPHILTRDDQCDRNYAHQSWLCPHSQFHDSARFRGDLQCTYQALSPEPCLSSRGTYCICDRPNVT